MSASALILDSGAVSAWASGHAAVRAWVQAAAETAAIVVVPAVVLAESVSGSGPRDARTNRVLHAAFIEAMDEQVARRAGALRSRTGAGRRALVADALVVAAAAGRPRCTVLTADPEDLNALGEAAGVNVVDFRVALP